MSKWLITTDPATGTPETVWYLEGTQGQAASALSSKSEEVGKSLSVWKLEGHTELDIAVTLVPDGE